MLRAVGLFVLANSNSNSTWQERHGHIDRDAKATSPTRTANDGPCHLGHSVGGVL